MLSTEQFDNELNAKNICSIYINYQAHLSGENDFTGQQCCSHTFHWYVFEQDRLNRLMDIVVHPGY